MKGHFLCVSYPTPLSRHMAMILALTATLLLANHGRAQNSVVTNVLVDCDVLWSEHDCVEVRCEGPVEHTLNSTGCLGWLNVRVGGPETQHDLRLHEITSAFGLLKGQIEWRSSEPGGAPHAVIFEASLPDDPGALIVARLDPSEPCVVAVVPGLDSPSESNWEGARRLADGGLAEGEPPICLLNQEENDLSIPLVFADEPACQAEVGRYDLVMIGGEFTGLDVDDAGVRVLPYDERSILVAEEWRHWDVLYDRRDSPSLWQLGCTSDDVFRLFYHREGANFDFSARTADGETLYFTDNSRIAALDLRTLELQHLTSPPTANHENCCGRRRFRDLVVGLSDDDTELVFERAARCDCVEGEWEWIEMRLDLTVDPSEPEEARVHFPQPVAAVATDTAGLLLLGDAGRCETHIWDRQSRDQIWRSEDNGEQWEAVNLGIDRCDRTAVSHIYADTVRPGHVVALTAWCNSIYPARDEMYGGYLVSTRDGGLTWTQLELPPTSSGRDREGGVFSVEVVDGDVDHLLIQLVADEYHDLPPTNWETYNTGVTWTQTETHPELGGSDREATTDRFHFLATGDGLVRTPVGGGDPEIVFSYDTVLEHLADRIIDEGELRDDDLYTLQTELVMVCANCDPETSTRRTAYLDDIQLGSDDEGIGFDLGTLSHCRDRCCQFDPPPSDGRYRSVVTEICFGWHRISRITVRADKTTLDPPIEADIEDKPPNDAWVWRHDGGNFPGERNDTSNDVPENAEVRSSGMIVPLSGTLDLPDTDWWTFSANAEDVIQVYCYSWWIGSGLRDATFSIFESHSEEPLAEATETEVRQASYSVIARHTGSYFLRATATVQSPDVMSNHYVCYLRIISEP